MEYWIEYVCPEQAFLINFSVNIREYEMYSRNVKA